MALISELAEFVARTSFDDLPKPVVEAAKLRILDTVGSGIWGRHEGDSGRLVSIAAELGGAPEATIWGEKKKLPATWAAYINGYAGIYMGDTCRFSGAHPGPVIVPAALAIAERENSSGKELITAVVLGYEIFVRIGRAIYPAIAARGFHATGVLGPIGAAASACKIFGLDKEQTTDALAISSTMGSGLLEAFKYLDCVALNMGRGAQVGILAALLAQKGFKGSDTILEGGFFTKGGFLAAFAEEYSPELITKDLGKEYMIPNVAPKIHWGCRHPHGPTDVVIEMVAKHKIKAEDIEEIRIKNHSEALKVERHPVKTRDDALWSSPYMIAVAILTNEPVYPDKFSDKMVKDAKVQELMAKVTVGTDPEIDKVFPQKWTAVAEIVTKDGKSYQHTLDYPKGEPENPVSKEEADNKFRMLARPDLGDENVEKVINIVDNLEAKKTSDLVSLLA